MHLIAMRTVFDVTRDIGFNLDIHGRAEDYVTNQRPLHNVADNILCRRHGAVQSPVSVHFSRESPSDYTSPRNLLLALTLLDFNRSSNTHNIND